MDFVYGEAELIERFRVIGLSSADDPTDSASLVQASNTAVKPRMINIFFITYHECPLKILDTNKF